MTKKKITKKKMPAALKIKPASSAALKLRPNIIMNDGEKGTVMVINMADTSKCFSVDGLAAQILKQIDGKKSLDAILKKIKVPPKTPAKDLEKLSTAFVKDLARLKIII